MKRKITVGLDDEGKIRSAHAYTDDHAKAFCRENGQTAKIVDWDGVTKIRFGVTVAEANLNP